MSVGSISVTSSFHTDNYKTFQTHVSTKTKETSMVVKSWEIFHSHIVKSAGGTFTEKSSTLTSDFTGVFLSLPSSDQELHKFIKTQPDLSRNLIDWNISVLDRKALDKISSSEVGSTEVSKDLDDYRAAFEVSNQERARIFLKKCSGMLTQSPVRYPTGYNPTEHRVTFVYARPSSLDDLITIIYQKKFTGTLNTDSQA